MANSDLFKQQRLLDDHLKYGFIGRAWLIEHIRTWLENTDQRFFLLTGDIGVGKSTFSAYLVRNQERLFPFAAYHFCMAGYGGTLSPIDFCRSIVTQLSAVLPNFSEALKAALDPQHVTITVTQNAQTMHNTTGIIINTLHIRGWDARETWRTLIGRPLAQIDPVKTPIIILVDALDEAAMYPQPNIVTLLAESSDLPPWIRFLITSRLDQKVLDAFKHPAARRITISSREELNLDDVKQYISERLARLTSTELSKDMSRPLDTIAEQIASRSEGNFLYTRLVLEDIADGRLSLDNLDRFPRDLYDIFHQFLYTRYPTFDVWLQVRPLYALLAVAREPLTMNHLVMFSGLEKQTIKDLLLQGHQFISEGNAQTYALFHSSFREYLNDEAHNTTFWIDLASWEEKICNYYLVHKESWAEEEGHYAVHHLRAHLLQIDRAALLLDLVENSKWYQASILHDPSAGEILLDLEQAIQAVEEQGVNGLPRLAAYSLFVGTMLTAAMRLPTSTLGVLVGLGNTQQALRYANLIRDPELRGAAFFEIAEALTNIGNQQTVIYAIDQGLETSPSVSSPLFNMLWFLKATDLMVRAHYPDGLHYLRALAQTLSNNPQNRIDKGKVLTAIAQGFVKLGQKETAFILANSKDPWERLVVLTAIAGECFPEEDQSIKQALETAMHSTFKTKPSNLDLRTAVIRNQASLFTAQMEFKKAVKFVAKIKDLFDQIEAICLLVRKSMDTVWSENLLDTALTILDKAQESDPGSQTISIAMTNSPWGSSSFELPTRTEVALADIALNFAYIGKIGFALELNSYLRSSFLKKSNLLTLVQEMYQWHIRNNRMDSGEVLSSALNEVLARYHLMEGEQPTTSFPDLRLEKLILLKMATRFVELKMYDRAKELLQQALGTTQDMHHLAENHLDLLADGAKVYLAIGDLTMTHLFTDYILQRTIKPKDGDGRLFALAALAKQLALVGKEKVARNILSQIQSERDKYIKPSSDFAVHLIQREVNDRLNGELLTILTYLGDTARAFEVIDGTHFMDRDPLQRKMAIALANVGKYEKAIEVVNEVRRSTKFGEPDPHLEIARAMARRQDFDQAVQVIRNMRSIQKVMAARIVAQLLFDLERKQEAYALLDEFVKQAFEYSPWMLLDIVEGMVYIHANEQAKQLLPHLIKVFEERGRSSIELATLSELLASVGLMNEARRVLKRAQSQLNNLWSTELVERFSGGLTYARILAAIAVAASRLGELPESHTLFQQAIFSAESVGYVPGGEARPLTWQYIAACFAQIGDYEQAFAMANKIPNLGDRAVAYDQIALVLLESQGFLKKYGITACQVGMRYMRSKGRDNCWIQLTRLLPVFIDIGADIFELWNKIQKVEMMWQV